MNRTFFLMFFIPAFLYIWVRILADFFKYLKYRLTVKREQISFDTQNNEPPVLVLEYDRPLWIYIFIIIIFLVLFYAFFSDFLARAQSRTLFFSLNKEQTYILYYWTLKFIFGSFLLYWGILVIDNFFNKKVYFFKDIVIVENTLIGRKSMVLDHNVRFTKSIYGKLYWLYNELSMKHFQIINDKLMKKIDSRQEKLLDEFLSKIPEKKKTFYI